MAKQWYVVHTYSGYEEKAKIALLRRIKENHMEHMFGEILVPMEDVVEVKKGAKRTIKRQFFPGYILVNVELDEITWHLVRGTPKITGFVGGTMNPPAVPSEEIDKLTKKIEEGTLRPKPKTLFDKGENVRVVSGPFSNFTGIVDDVNNDKGKLRVLVSIFGRSTPIELEFTQVEKTS